MRSCFQLPYDCDKYYSHYYEFHGPGLKHCTPTKQTRVSCLVQRCNGRSMHVDIPAPMVEVESRLGGPTPP